MLAAECKRIGEYAAETDARAQEVEQEERAYHELRTQILVLQARSQRAIAGTTEIARAEPDTKYTTPTTNADMDAALQLAEEKEQQCVALQKQISVMTVELMERERRLEQARRELDARRSADMRSRRKLHADYEHSCHALMPNLVIHSQVIGWLAEQTDKDLIAGAMKAMQALDQGNLSRGDHGRMMSGFAHVAFRGDHRLYYANDGRCNVVLIGDKHSQKRDESRLRRLRSQLYLE
jgi:hypothetical protein